MATPKPSSEFAHDGEKFFDSAALALIPESILRDSIQREKKDWNKLVDDARDSIGGVLAPTDNAEFAFNPARYVALFANTTAAFGRVLLRIERTFDGNRPTLLTTDLEYPGCVVAIDDRWSGPVVMAQINARLMSQRRDHDAILHEALTRMHNFIKPSVVFVSHVMRTTGQQVSPRTLRHLREANPCVVIILDGSQAIGNIVVTKEVLDTVDFYIASGHKWLGGMTTSGFVWCREPDRWRVDDPSQSVAYRSQLGGTGNAAAWESLSASVRDMTLDSPLQRIDRIAKYNKYLGRRFHRQLAPVRNQVTTLTPMTGKPASTGIVTIGIPNRSAAPLVEALTREGYEFTVLAHEDVEWKSGSKERFLISCDPHVPVVEVASKYTFMRSKLRRTELRFCFHYWHTTRDVDDLCAFIVAHLRAARRGPRKPAKS